MSNRYLVNKNKLIYSELFVKSVTDTDEPIVYIDAGARGDLDSPWADIDDCALRIIGFEPDMNECRKLNEGQSTRNYYPHALWSDKGTVKIHCASTPSCSSVHSPNMHHIMQYAEAHWKSREVQSVKEYQAVSLDQVLNENDINADFIKIDTQGSEYEILTGASQSLDNDILGVIVETWTSEVHKGQHLTGDVMRFMHENGFSLFDVNVAASWKLKSDQIFDKYSKNQIIGMDLFFLKNSAQLLSSKLSEAKILKYAALAEVFGFPAYANEFLNKVKGNRLDGDVIENAMGVLKNNYKGRNCWLEKIYNRVHSFLGTRRLEYPLLHY